MALRRANPAKALEHHRQYLRGSESLDAANPVGAEPRRGKISEAVESAEFVGKLKVRGRRARRLPAVSMAAPNPQKPATRTMSAN